MIPYSSNCSYLWRLSIPRASSPAPPRDSPDLLQPSGHHLPLGNSTQVATEAGCRLPFSITGEGLLLHLRTRSMVVWNDKESTPSHTHSAPHRGQVELHLVSLSIELSPMKSLLLSSLGVEGEKHLLHCQKLYYLR